MELGRLSVIRSPDKVLARALAEVVSNGDGSLASVYSLPAAEFSGQLGHHHRHRFAAAKPGAVRGGAEERGPQHGAALGGQQQLTELSAMFIGTASDKTIPVTTDTVKALLTIAGYSLPDSVIADIAAKAEQARIDIMTAHG